MSVSPSPQHRCSTCNSASVNPRNLAVFIDGTSHKPGPEKTNVLKLYDVLLDGQGPELVQHKYYLEGIGVYDVNDLPLSSYVGNAIYSGLEAAFAWNVEKNIKDAYGWLVDKYQEGDKIYLFGFSRGAYQVRALASMIHEVGLVKEKSGRRIDQAYRRYLSIDPKSPMMKESMEFKENFCWQKVRIHFIGVWDTVSSLGLTKRDVHITASASVTNACHFRHALALDERRVKFMPEYFLEVNSHHGNIRSPRSAVSDVKEVWFAGFHSDVGGASRPHTEGVPNPVDDDYYPVHAGNVPLLWMRREAAANGLVFKSEMFSWLPEDVDLGRKDSMEWYWRSWEVVPIRHQVSFNGSGKNESRKHDFHPRLVIPGQQIHFSALPGDMYTPPATLAYGVEVPTVPQNASGGLWPAEPVDEEATTRLLTSLLGDEQETLKSFWEVLHLLSFRLDNGQTQTMPTPGWLETCIRERSGLDKFTLIVIYDVISNFSVLQQLVTDARAHLSTVLSSPNRLDFPRALYILRFSARHQTLRQRFIAHDDVIDALMLALERIAESPSENLFPLIMDSLRYLVGDNDHQTKVIDQLTARLNGTKTGQTKLSLALEMKAPSHLMASLTMIACLARHQPDHCVGLRPRIIELEKKGKGPVGAAAVEALVALKVPLPRGIHFSSILGYLANTLPRLDVEIDSASSPSETGDLPPVLQVNGSGELDEKVMHKLVLAIEPWNAPQRTAATLTLLKLCNNSVIRDFCSRNKVLDIFMKQLERKETSLLAAYALNACLKLNMWTSNDFGRAAQLVVDMVDKSWFDNAVGRVEGSKIFRELMTSGNLRQQVIDCGIFATLSKKLEVGDCCESRMALICLDILWRENQVDMPRIVTESLDQLRDRDIKLQKRGVKTLSSLAMTEIGEQAIKPRVSEIVRMLLPPMDGSPPPRCQLFGPTAALYNLCKNETLRKEIERCNEYGTFKRQRQISTLYPQTR